jgi:electron transport complex protein RnfG
MSNIYVRLGIPTVLICAVAAAGLAGTYALTKGPIAAQDKATQERALFAVLPGAKSFVEIAGPAIKDKAVLDAAVKAAPDVTVASIFTALDASGSPIGWGVTVKSRGYGGPMVVVVGVDRNGKVTGLNIASHNETPGLGTRAVGVAGEPPTKLVKSVTGIDSPEKALRLDGVTGATKSSRGVRRGAEAAMLVYSNVLKALGGGGSK